MSTETMANAVVFDKDGTLIDFWVTWNQATHELLSIMTGSDPDRLAGAAQAVGYDLAERTIKAGSPLIAESNAVIGEMLRPWIDPSIEIDSVRFNQLAAQAAKDSLVALPGADETLRQLQRRGIRAAIATNDAEIGARTMVDALGWHELFDAVVGYDSGWGAKPDPAMITGVLNLLGVEPGGAIMVGDSQHDIDAGHAAGARTVLIEPDPNARWTPRPGAVEPDYRITALAQLLPIVDQMSV